LGQDRKVGVVTHGTGSPDHTAGILNALATLQTHEQLGPPITIEQSGPPIIPGNPIFEIVPAAQIIETIFHQTTTTVDVLGVAGLHDPLIG
jgi:hypothetical protein